MIQRIKSKHELDFVDYCQWRDKRQDFYSVKNGERIYLDNIKLAKSVFKDVLKRKPIGYISEDEKNVNGLLITTDDVSQKNRHFIKILTRKLSIAEGLLRVLLWNHKQTFYVRIKKYNPLIKLFKKFRFRFVKDEDAEIIMCHLPRKERK